MNKNDKNEEVKTNVQEVPITTKDSTKEVPPVKTRQIIIETDGNTIQLVKAEVSGKIELSAILQNVISFINQQK